jgi:putative glycosyltransferase (TIGR04348 family)
VNIRVVTPAPVQLHTGNRTTAVRWARLLGELGHQVQLGQDWSGEECDLLVTLHARRSFPSLERFHQAHPNAPVVVALTGTDLYDDLKSSAEARRSLEIASRLIVLQPLALDAIPADLRGKGRVIYQSAAHSEKPDPPAGDLFQICVLAHLRTVKDPLRTAYATRDLPVESRVRVAHAGGVLDPELAREAEAEQRRNPRYRWLGDLSHHDALRLLAGSHLLALTSLLEGGANVISEAIAVGLPVISTYIPGSLGILGPDYPGYFPVGDTRALCRLLQQVEADHAFYADLKRRVQDLRPLVNPDLERESWRALLAEVGQSAVTA